MHMGCFVASILPVKIFENHCTIDQIPTFEDFQHVWEVCCQPFGENTFSKSAPKTKQIGASVVNVLNCGLPHCFVLHVFNIKESASIQLCLGPLRQTLRVCNILPTM